jgi:hypothetical protein
MKLKITCTLLCATQLLVAQTFTEVPLPTQFDEIDRGCIEFADIDGDNDQDLLITGAAAESSIATLYRNNGSGKFSKIQNASLEGVYGSSVAFGDLDGDTDLDLLVTGRNSDGVPSTRLYINDGKGNFTESANRYFDNVNFGSVAFADIDGDTDLDVLIAGQNASSQSVTKLYANDGLGSFTEVTNTPFAGVGFSSIAFADIDGDKDPDVLITGYTNTGAIAKLYKDSAGIYTEVLGTPFENLSGNFIAFEDVDADDDLDLLILGQRSSGQRITKMYLNDGTGIFIEEPNTPFEGLRFGSISFADVDGDNDQDVLLSGQNNAGSTITKLYTNNGSGKFNLIAGTSFEGMEYGATSFADIDNDGDKDLFIAGSGIAKLYLNDGTGTFTTAKEALKGLSQSSLAFDDVDNDGDLDILMMGRDYLTFSTWLLLNDGNGDFGLNESTSFEGLAHGSMDIADLNGDSYNDILITGWNSAFEQVTKLYLNDGKGKYVEDPTTPFINVVHGDADVADIDGDNDLDVLITGYAKTGKESRLYLNDGNGSYFEATGLPFQGTQYSSIAFADIDGDNDQDVLITGEGRNSTHSTIYTNDGDGNFSEDVESSLEAVKEGAVAFADIDWDNDLDLILTGSNSKLEPITKLYSNNGKGIFTEITSSTFVNVHSPTVVFQDVDNDDDQDLWISGRDAASNRISKLYINDGTGSYTELTTSFIGISDGSVGFADIDNDKDVDLIVTGTADEGIIFRMYTNDGTASIVRNQSAGELALTPYPNPIHSGTLNLVYNSHSSQEITLSVFSLHGVLLQNNNIKVNQGEQLLALPVDHLANGMYILMITDEELISSAKFLVE